MNEVHYYIKQIISHGQSDHEIMKIPHGLTLSMIFLRKINNHENQYLSFIISQW